ncbi:MAG TPA: hypothetical protein VFF88_04390, partial [Methylocella sp.]|nr:hypothetical protein [Methylocella sp.]
MRKTALLLLLAAVFLWGGGLKARESFVTGDLENSAIRLEQNIGRDVGALAGRPAVQLRKEAQQALARNDFESALKLFAALAAA